MAIESTAMARFARVGPRKARMVVNMVRGQKVAEALEVLAFTRKIGAPIIKKLIESAISNAKQANAGLDVDGLYVSVASVDKGPNKHLRRWRPRAMGRATQIVKGVSHIAITLTDQAPPLKGRARVRAEKFAAKQAAAPKTAAAAPTTSA